MKKILAVILFMLSSFANAGNRFDVLDEIANSLRSGDAKSVSRFFGNTIDLTISNQEEVYSKIQAEQILKDFFNKNRPRSFTIIHKGESKEGAKYAIGTYISANGISYRTYYYVKASGTSGVIQELRFMKE